MAVGSTLAYVTPHLNGAIDIMAVRQPDGTIKTSPFYGEGMLDMTGFMPLCQELLIFAASHRWSDRCDCAVRFGKYTGSGVQNRAVKIIVNGMAACHMPCCACVCTTCTADMQLKAVIA